MRYNARKELRQFYGILVDHKNEVFVFSPFKKNHIIVKRKELGTVIMCRLFYFIELSAAME